ncbi:carbon-nitrogen hydrolase family protein [Salinibacterium sp. ZJ454]|uniref:carbon-nitrogen hydrolase family protein n=1 Tax=Salinibacterium sp. ZJ454 TaxID=2708339 RepID=UPI00141DB423|nr:carbon-nitrogen hydrolase family protein [Salinibacterium sp. ZJ454]
MSSESPGSLTVAVVQFAPTTNGGANIEQIAEFVARAVDRGADLVVFPEYSSYFSAEMGPDWLAAAEPLDGLFVSELAAIAAAQQVHIAAGVVEATDGTRFSNTVVVVDAAGSLVATSRKLHLYDAFGHRESDYAVAGPIVDPELFEIRGIQIGVQTCYDLRFPEVTRRLVDAGADLVLVPSEWVRGPLKEHHWRTLVTARALENTIYIAAADHAPPIGVGNSMIVDPMGVALASIGDDPGIALAEVSLERIESVREVNPALSLRRFRVVPVG